MSKNKEEDINLPLMAVYGFLPGVGASDARAYIDSLVERHLAEYSEDICYFDLVKWRDGYAYELKAGGDGLSDIRSIIRILDENPRGTKIYLDSVMRQAEIFLRAEGDERFMFRLLQEGAVRQPVTDMGKRQKARLLVPTYRNILGAGFSFAAMGVVFLAAAVMSMQLITSNNESVAMKKTHDRIVDLPMWHSPKTVNLNPGQYLGKIQYENGRWLPPLVLCGNEECKPHNNQGNSANPHDIPAPPVLPPTGLPGSPGEPSASNSVDGVTRQTMADDRQNNRPNNGNQNNQGEGYQANRNDRRADNQNLQVNSQQINKGIIK